MGNPVDLVPVEGTWFRHVHAGVNGLALSHGGNGGRFNPPLARPLSGRQRAHSLGGVVSLAGRVDALAGRASSPRPVPRHGRPHRGGRPPNVGRPRASRCARPDAPDQRAMAALSGARLTARGRGRAGHPVRVRCPHPLALPMRVRRRPRTPARGRRAGRRDHPTPPPRGLRT